MSTSVLKRLERDADCSAEKALLIALEGLPQDSRSAPVSVAISPADLACSDAWTLPDSFRGRAARLGASLVESRCTSETLEALAVDVALSASHAQAIALDRVTIEAVAQLGKQYRLRMVTSIPAILAQVFGAVALIQGGEQAPPQTPRPPGTPLGRSRRCRPPAYLN